MAGSTPLIKILDINGLAPVTFYRFSRGYPYAPTTANVQLQSVRRKIALLHITRVIDRLPNIGGFAHDDVGVCAAAAVRQNKRPAAVAMSLSRAIVAVTNIFERI